MIRAFRVMGISFGHQEESKSRRIVSDQEAEYLQARRRSLSSALNRDKGSVFKVSGGAGLRERAFPSNQKFQKLCFLSPFIVSKCVTMICAFSTRLCLLQMRMLYAPEEICTDRG